MHCTTENLDHNKNRRNLTYDIISTHQKLTLENLQYDNKNSHNRNKNQSIFSRLEGDFIQQRNILKRYMQERGYCSRSIKTLNHINKGQSINTQCQIKDKNIKTERKIEIMDNSQQYFLPEFNDNTRFFKPYLQNTKFVDLIVKNKRLLRRGLFDMPIENITNSFKKIESIVPKSNQKQKKIQNKPKFISHYASLPKKLKLNFNDKQSSKSARFNTTIEESQYKKIFSKGQRNQIQYQNSLNRIIAVENIRQKLSKKNYHKKKIMIYQK